MPSAVQMLLIVFPALVIVAALHDAATMTIPNWISLALLVMFFPAALVAGLAPHVIGICLATGVLALIAGIIMFALRWIGGGDAKLFAASALWLGLPGLPYFLAWTALAGGALALLLLGARNALALTGFVPPRVTWIERLLAPKGDIPYGIAIAAGALASFTESPLMRAAAT